MKTKWLNSLALAAAFVAVALLAVHNLDFNQSHELLNVSYAPTGDLYNALDQQFSAEYAKQNGTRLTVKQSHGGSSRQAKAVINGQEADVVTLALPSDVEALHKRGLIADGWEQRLPNNSQPYTSTIVFVVRKGNPKGIKDWPDLITPGVEVVTPNPKTSGNGKLSLLAAWGSIIYRGGTEDQARDYIRQLYQHVTVLGTSATDSTATFAYDKVGDVHLTWENEALREVADAKGELQIVYPPVSIRAEPSVAWVDANVVRHNTEASAKAYLEFLFTDEAQETIAEQGYRPFNADILNKHLDRLPNLDLFPVTLIARDWDDAQSKFFADNAIFDVIYKPKAN
ncbi:MAG: sulfate ABC transporter substrate-binding protein [Methylacidiphilales bacterium]|nr:sulfate ABC transporter substrate-binding protein [Candidatus Methylacidiphilales bacterium]